MITGVDDSSADVDLVFVDVFCFSNTILQKRERAKQKLVKKNNRYPLRTCLPC